MPKCYIEGNERKRLLSAMATVRTKIAYDGVAIRDGSMDVRDLAPALLGVGQLFDAANRSLNGEDAPPITVKVVATGAGSFEIDLELVQGLWAQTVGLLSGETITALINLKELVLTRTAVGASLIGLTIWLRGRRPDRIEKKGDGEVQITVDGETITVPVKLLRLYQDIATRKAVEAVIKDPLEKDGISSFKVIEDDVVVSSVNETEVSYFETPALTETVLVEDVRTTAFSIISLAFKDDNKWRLHDGNTQINASIEDADFLARVNLNLIRFAKGDVLVCRVRLRQTQTANGIRTEYVVEKVERHIQAQRQLDLFADPAPNGTKRSA